MQPRVTKDMKEVLFGFVRKKKGIELRVYRCVRQKVNAATEGTKSRKVGGKS